MGNLKHRAAGSGGQRLKLDRDLAPAEGARQAPRRRFGPGCDRRGSCSTDTGAVSGMSRWGQAHRFLPHFRKFTEIVPGRKSPRASAMEPEKSTSIPTHKFVVARPVAKLRLTPRALRRIIARTDTFRTSSSRYSQSSERPWARERLGESEISLTGAHL